MWIHEFKLVEEVYAKVNKSHSSDKFQFYFMKDEIGSSDLLIAALSFRLWMIKVKGSILLYALYMDWILSYST